MSTSRMLVRGITRGSEGILDVGSGLAISRVQVRAAGCPATHSKLSSIDLWYQIDQEIHFRFQLRQATGPIFTLAR